MEVMLAPELDDKAAARRSLDLTYLDDIPEERALERALSGKSSEEKEITRLDSGLGEWDSESSRKTSFSSQGRLSPDFAMAKDPKETNGVRSDISNNNKDSVKRRRSGMDMVNTSPPNEVDENGDVAKEKKVKKLKRLPKIQKGMRASGIWERKISPAGVQYLKMADEMEEVRRNGAQMMVPKKISDHIPTVPIHSVDRFEVEEWNENLGLEDEELQIYKTPHSEVYQLHRHRWEFFGKMDFRKMMIQALDGNAWMNGQQKFEMMRDLVSKKEAKQMDKMLAQGFTHDEIVDHFMADATKKSGNNDLSRKLMSMMKEDMSEEQAIAMMKNELGLGAKSQKLIDEMLKQGYSAQDIMKKMMTEGQTQEEELLETSDTMKHLMSSKKKNIKQTPKQIQAMLEDRLDEESKAKMKEMLAAGVPLQEVLDKFAKQFEPESTMTCMEKKIQDAKDAAAADGKELSQAQIFELMKDSMDSESKKKMDAMLKSGMPLDEVIEHFMKKGKTKEEAQKEKSEQLRKIMEEKKDMSPEEVVNMLRDELGEEDKKQMEKMLKSGCSMQEVMDHFMNRGMEEPTDEKTEFQKKMEQMMEGKNLNEDEVLALMRSQVDEETKKEMAAMLAKGYSKQDVINHLMKNMKTDEEKDREAVKKLEALFNDQDMSEEEKVSMLGKQLNSEDQAQMEEMLKNGCSIEEVMGHFMSRKSPEKEKSKFAQNIEKLIAGKDLSPDAVLDIISEQLDDEQRQKMEEMLSKGYTKQDVINHFMRTAKTKEEQMQETADKIKALMNDENMSEENKLEMLRNQLSKEDLAQMEELLRDGGSLQDVMQTILKSKSMDSIVENELSAMVHKAMAEGNLSNSEVLGLIKGQLDEKDKAEMAAMLAKGMTEQEVIDHFLNNGKTANEKKRETSEKLQALLSEASTPEAQLEVMRGALEGADRAQMEQMLKSGCSIEEVMKHFSNRGMEPSGQESPSALADMVKKLSGGKELSPDEMLSLIGDQMTEEGRKAMQEMLSKGYSKEDVIQHFLANGKTKKEQQNETANRLSLLDTDNMSAEEIEMVMKEQLSPSEKKMMEQMLKQGMSMKDIVKHFIELKDVEPVESALSIKLKKLSGGKKLSSKEMVDLMAEQMGDSDRREMEDMLASGASMEEVLRHFMEHGRTKEEEQREVANKLASLMSDSMTEEDIKSLLQSELNSADRKKMDEMLMSGYSIEEILEHFQTRGMEPGEESDLAAKIRKISRGRKLSSEQMLQLIKDQLGDVGKEQMEEMLKSGMSPEEVISHFMTEGKTEEEERRDISLKLAEMTRGRKLSNDEKLDFMKEQLGKADRAQMEEMLKRGCTIEEVFELFTSRGSTPNAPRTELANRVKKHSKGRILPKKDVLTLIKMQLTEESKVMLDKMLERGYKESDVIEFFLTKGKTLEEEHREVAAQLDKLINVHTMSDDKIIDIMKSVLGPFDKTQVEDMLRRGCQTPEIVHLFLNRGKNPAKKTEFAARMERLLNGQLLPPQEVLAIMRENLDDDSRESIDQLLKKGYTVQDVIEHMFKTGKTPEEKQREVAEKMLHLLEGDMSEEQVLEMMRKQLGSAGRKELEEMLARGCSLNDIIDSFMHKPSELALPDEDTEFAKKIKQLMGDKTLSAEQMMNLIKSQLDPNGQMQLDEMVRCGCSHDEIIQHFMNREKNKKGQKRNEFGRKMYELTKGKKLTKKELVMLMKNHLAHESLVAMEEMLKKGYPIEDVIDYFLKFGKTPQEALRAKTLQKEKEKKEAAKKLREQIEGNNLSNDEILAILQLSMGDEDRAQLDLMLKRGCSTQEIIEHFMNRDVSDEETEKTLFQKKMDELMVGKNLDSDQVLDLMMNELDDESVIQMNQMLQRGYTKEDVIKYFMKHGDDRNDFVNEMKKLAGDKDMSKDEILDLMKSKLGVMSQRKMEDMIREGYSAEEIIQHLMTHGKTQEQETKLFTRRMSILLEREVTLTDKEKVDKIKEHLGKEAASMLEELLKNGFTHAGLLDLFLRHGNDVNSLVLDDFFIRDIRFPDEPEDAESLKNRNVFSVIDKDDSKARISYMSPSGKMHIFGLFFEMVLEVVAGKGLTHREILDLMRSRMGAGYAKEFDELRKKGFTLQQIVDYFLKRDEETISESRLVAKLKAEARVDSRVYLKREYSKEKWGVSLTYTYSKNHGLHLILNDVVENGPAWESGVRAGDVIVTVNDWLIVLMDRPQVAAHLFQAGANIVKLGIQKTRGSSPDKYLGLY